LEEDKQTFKLDDKKQTLKLQFVEWACACANWATIDDINKAKSTGRLPEYCLFIEPADKKLTLPDTIGYNGDIVEFTGQFYTDKGFPNNFIKTEEPVDKARVFRYFSFKVIKSNFRAMIDSTNKNDKKNGL
jgi:hypothetical protein